MLEQLIRTLFLPKKVHGNRTVRYAFPLVAVAALILGVASIVGENTSFITVTTSTDRVEQGDSFYITVSVTAHTPINAVDIVLDYPTNRITVDGIDTGTSVITLWTEEPYARNGKIYLRGGTFKKGFIGAHTIARIRATAKESGTAVVNTNVARFVAGDGFGTDVPVGDNGAPAQIVIAEAGTLVATGDVVIVTDLDGDGRVDIKDISAFMAAWFTRGKTFDFNGDGRMTFKDFSILLADSFSRF